MASGNRSRGEESGRGATSALNEAVLELRKAESSMCQNPGPGGTPTKKPGSMTQQVGELGEKQAKLNQETRSLAQRLSEQMRLSSGDRNQLQRLSEQQQRLREQLEQIQRDEEVKRELLGKLEGARRDMQETEEILSEGSQLGEVEQRQQRILSRLLDAQRSVNRRDFEPQRESRPGEDVVRRSAPELPPDLLKESDRLRLDLLKAEADRYPAQYRAFVEAYLRRLNGSRR
jgi:DNA repair exonuclease SbcCD ATPase subunit